MPILVRRVRGSRSTFLDPTWTLGPNSTVERSCLHNRGSLSILNQSLVSDTRTRVFYEFPEFRIARVCCYKVMHRMYHGSLPLTTRLQHGLCSSPRQKVNIQIVPTNTHVITCHAFVWTGPRRRMYLASSRKLSLSPMIGPQLKVAARVCCASLMKGYTLERETYDGFNSTCITLTLDRPSLNTCHPCPSANNVFASMVTRRSTMTSI